MPSNDSWIYQGRQQHGWFGDGTSPKDDTSKDPAGATNQLSAPANAAQRIDYAAHSIIMRVPQGDRSRWNSAVTDSARDNLKTAVAGWYGGTGLSRDAFRARFLDPSTSDQTVDRLRSAARGMVEGRNYDDLSQAGKDLATAAQQVGVYRWPRFLGDASARAVEAVANGTVPGVTKVAADTAVDIVGFAELGALVYMFASRRSYPSAPPDRSTAPSGPLRPTITQAVPPSTVPGAPPNSSPSKATVSEERRKHILDGDSDGGGHRPGQNLPGKSEFPPGWSDDRIIGNIESVANDPASSRQPGRRGRTVVSGSRDGVDIDVVVEGDGKTIVTGFPTNTPRNPKGPN